MIQIKRAYEAPTEQDGYRVLVDRIYHEENPRNLKS